MLPKVDVIIPVYNEIERLDRCVNSVLAQTYDNYGIILVDDGSYDGSEKKCEEYSKKHRRITTMHQTNKGLGAARNAGVKVSEADFILFVDSDDYIHQTMIELLVNAIYEKKADMATMKLAAVTDDSNCNTTEKPSINEIILMNTKDALEDMCYMWHFGFSACSKLIKREFLIKYPFPEGILYEDSAMMYKIIGECMLIVHINWTGYYYTQSVGKGITRGKYDDNQKSGIIAAEELREYLAERFPDILDAGRYRIAYSMYLITKTLIGGTKEEIQIYKRIRNALCEAFYKEGVYKNSKVNLKRRVQIGLATCGYIFMVASWKLYYMLIGVRKVR